MVELVIRLVFSLAVVLGMLLLLTRFSAKRFRGGNDALVRVVHRQPLSRTSAVAVVTVGPRVLVVGTTEHQVQLLTELDPDELDLPLPVASLGPAPDPGFDAGFDAGFEVGCEVAADVEAATVESAAAAEPAEAESAHPAPDFEVESAHPVPEFTSLDELLGSPVESERPDADLVAASYAPRHAARASARSRSTATADPAPAGRRATPADGPLAGSILSAQTWKQAFAAATSRSRDAS